MKQRVGKQEREINKTERDSFLKKINKINNYVIRLTKKKKTDSIYLLIRN